MPASKVVAPRATVQPRRASVLVSVRPSAESDASIVVNPLHAPASIATGRIEVESMPVGLAPPAMTRNRASASTASGAAAAAAATAAPPGAAHSTSNAPRVSSSAAASAAASAPAGSVTCRDSSLGWSTAESSFACSSGVKPAGISSARRWLAWRATTPRLAVGDCNSAST